MASGDTSMWILLAFLSALFAGVTSILAKIGIQHSDSTVATAIRTVVVLILSWVIVFIVGSQTTIPQIDGRAWLFLVLSGLATGASWLCYFRDLQLGNINKVVPIDKSSTVLAMLLAFIFLGEQITWLKGLCMAAIAVGTYLMIEKKPASETVPASGDAAANTQKSKHSKGWLFYALLSAVFAALTSILGKIGIDGVESNLGTAIRTAVVLVMAWVMVLVTGKTGKIKEIPRRELWFILLSGLTTGGSWLCYYRALKDGQASVVVPIDKLSILVTILFSYIVFHEKLTKKSGAGLLLIVAGTLGMLVQV